MKKRSVPGKIKLLETFSTDKEKKYIRRGKYKCFCGKEFTGTISEVKNGHTKSCGCYKKSGLNFKHGHCVVGARNRLHDIYTQMVYRCCSKKATSYKHYGGRGITICEEWRNDFTKFRDWALANGYTDKLSIDRINNDGNYEPGNCRWVSRQIQSINRRNKTRNLPTGVHSSGDRFSSYIVINRINTYLGTFNTATEASEAYQKAKKERDTLYLKSIKQL